MKKIISLIMFVFTFNANAALITLGSYSFEDYQFADSYLLEKGVSSRDPSNAVGANFDSFVSVDSSNAFSFNFSDNFLLNGSGFDIFVFELAAVETPGLSLSLEGLLVEGTFIETVKNVPNARFQVNIFGYDLGDLGIGLGSLYAGDLFLRTSSREPDIAAVAAINGGKFSNAVEASAPGSMLLFSLFLITAVTYRRNLR